MGVTKNMVRGTVLAVVYVLTTMVVPFITFTWLFNLGTVEGYNIALTMDASKYQQIVFWICAFGLLISATAFFGFSAPKKSVRRAVFGLIQVILNCLYIWSYKFSGALEMELILVGYGTVGVNLQRMILMYLGIYFLTIILKVYDLIDFTTNRKKLKEKRIEKALKKKSKK